MGVQLLKILKVGGLIVSVPIILLVLFYFWGSSGSYPQEKYNQITKYDTKTTPGEDGILTVISYNIGYLSGLENAATSQEATQVSKEFYEQNLQTVITALKSLNPDFIGLQEVDIQSKRSYKVNQVAELAKNLGLPTALIGINWDKNYIPFPYFPLNAHFGRTVAAQSILSRYLITKGTRIVLEPVQSQPFYYRAFYLDRIAQVAEIDVKGQPLIIINVHLEAFDEPTRTNQTEEIKELAEEYAQKYPVLLIGDFNSSLNRQEESQPSIQLLLKSAIFQSAINPGQLKSGKFATYPSNQPKYTLDYIFYNRDRIQLIDAQVITSTETASDHLPVMMRFRLRNFGS